MSIVRQHILTLKPAAQKLACLFAYIGQAVSDDDKTQLSVHGACMLGELPLLTKTLVDDGIVGIQPPSHFGGEFQFIRPRYYGEVMLFAIDEHPEWLDEFDQWPLTRHRDFKALQASLRQCGAGRTPSPMVLPSEVAPYLVGLAHDRRFESLVTMIRDVDFPAFISAVMRKWMRDDWTDPNEMLKRQMSMRKFDATDPDIREMRALWNYYNYVCLGIYTPPTSIRMTYPDLLSKGVHAMSQGKSDLALKVLSEAVTASARTAAGKAEARFLTDGVAAFYWVIALWTSKQNDAKSKLREFVAFSRQNGWRRVGAAVLLAETLTTPMQRMDMDTLAQLLTPVELADREYRLQQLMALLLAANFTGYKLDKDNFQPQSAFLRHEGAAYVTLNRFEKKMLTTAFGPKPISAIAKSKEPWEQMLDRLIATESRRESDTAEVPGQRRVMYIITSDGESVELREQNRLKDGRWGNGKSLPWVRFISGAEPFMDRTDQAIVADVRYLQTSRLTAGILMPHLVGSDRIYSGEHTPYRRVTIEEQKPYVIIERTDEAFRVQSNVLFKDLISQSNVYRRDDELHYVYFPMSDHERSVLQELLSVASLPLEAEDKLRQLLPLITDVVDIHSDLVDDERELPSLESQSSIILRMTPDPTTQTYFDAFLLARPLQGGQISVVPGQGDRAVIDKSESTAGRIRVERDLEAEQRNLDQTLAYCMAHMIEFTPGLSAHLTTPQVLDMLAFAGNNPGVMAVEWPEGERLHMHTAVAGTWNLALKPRNNRWFEIEGNVQLDDNSVLTAQQLLNAIGTSRNGYIQLKDGEYLWLSEKLRRQLERLEAISTHEDGTATVSAMQTSLLAEIVHGEIDIGCSSDFDDLKQRIDQAEQMEPDVPEGLQAKLRSYQKEGYQWMMRLSAWGAGACLADDMGLGKTVQTIAFLLAHAGEGPSLVIAPASVIPNWQAEMARFAPSLHCYRMGEYFDRRKLVEEVDAGDIVMATYGLVTTAAEHLQSREWNTICLDEAHVIKNRGTKTSVAIMQCAARNRIILTGTPVQNHLGELWNLFQFINPGLLGSYDQFNQKFIQPIETQQDEERQTQLQTLVAPFLLRRTKQAVVTELPEKTEININVELSDDEMAFYEVMRKRAEELFHEEGNQMSINILAELTRLRQTACSAELTDPTWTAGSSKTNAFMELVQNIVEGGHSVLVFSQFTSFLTLIKRRLSEAGLQFLYLDGSISMRQREQTVADFQKGKCPIFLISLKAGGVGLNLTAANYVIHLDPWWNPAIEQQATDRAYRIGQKQAVTVYHLISHHTIEEKIIRLHESKRALSDSILEGAEQTFRLTSQEMLEMLSNQW